MNSSRLLAGLDFHAEMKGRPVDPTAQRTHSCSVCLSATAETHFSGPAFCICELCAWRAIYYYEEIRHQLVMGQPIDTGRAVREAGRRVAEEVR